jgi:hypothetical protein
MVDTGDKSSLDAAAMITLRKFVDGLAEGLGVEAGARKKWWQRRGVPLKWRRRVIAAADQQGVQIDWDDLDKGPQLERCVRVHNVPSRSNEIASTSVGAA